MSEDKYKVDIIENAIKRDTENELLGNITIKCSKPAKFKKLQKKDKALADLNVGKFVVVKVLKRSKGSGSGDVRGYLLCQLLDWRSDTEGWWDTSTKMILQVVKSSHADLDHMVGRLTTAEYRTADTYWNWSLYSVVSFKRDFVKWR